MAESTGTHERKKMRRFAAALIICTVLTLSAAPTRGGDRSAGTGVQEYRLGEIVIKGEREKPRVYFIIPKAKLRLEKLPLPSDYTREIRNIKIKR